MLGDPENRHPVSRVGQLDVKVGKVVITSAHKRRPRETHWAKRRIGKAHQNSVVIPGQRHHHKRQGRGVYSKEGVRIGVSG